MARDARGRPLCAARGSRSISNHVAPRASPLRHAVKLRNSRQRAHTAALAQPLHECADLTPRPRRVVDCCLHLAALRQQIFEMTAPVRRVLVFAPAACLGGIKDALDAPAHSRCGFRFLTPQRLDDLHDRARIHGSNRQLAKHRQHVIAQACCAIAEDAWYCAMKFRARRCTCSPLVQTSWWRLWLWLRLRLIFLARPRVLSEGLCRRAPCHAALGPSRVRRPMTVPRDRQQDRGPSSASCRCACSGRARTSRPLSAPADKGRRRRHAAPARLPSIPLPSVSPFACRGILPSSVPIRPPMRPLIIWPNGSGRRRMVAE